ncbi:hypothetical protein C2G38_2119549 [Gigaspora rosea]|uniref:SWIM-type domain-containing protein n=1 Tax=Gigaspora rosea TaxID=44941 RepID=A0A397U3T3_9GLOM|nr:hypothetical protein C2G38_2119549 [Gigaspora rosea]
MCVEDDKMCEDDKMSVDNNDSISSTFKNKGKMRAEADDNNDSSTSNNKGKMRAEDEDGESSTSNNNKRKADDSGDDNSNAKKRKEDNGNDSSSSKKKKQKRPRKPKERRQARCRTVCSKRVKDRINRATSQRMFLIERKNVDATKSEFTVLGATGNVYTVTICHLPNCTCPDFQKGNLCKHILFVYIKVLRVQASSKLIFQRALLTKELRAIFAKSQDYAALANYRVRSLYNTLCKAESKEETVQRRPIEGDCAICYEPLEPTENLSEILWCRGGCGNNLHKECFLKWKSSRMFGRAVTCVYCRREWKEHITERYTKDGFINLGQIQTGVRFI